MNKASQAAAQSQSELLPWLGRVNTEWSEVEEKVTFHTEQTATRKSLNRELFRNWALDSWQLFAFRVFITNIENPYCTPVLDKGRKCQSIESCYQAVAQNFGRHRLNGNSLERNKARSS